MRSLAIVAAWMLCNCSSQPINPDVTNPVDSSTTDVVSMDSSRDDTSTIDTSTPIDTARMDTAPGDTPITNDVPATTLALGTAAIAQRTHATGPSRGTLTTMPVTTRATGSTLLVSLARGTWADAPDAPTDNRSNTFAPLGTTHAYAAWPTSQTGLFHALNATGGADHTFSMTWGPASGGDEVSLSAVEVLGVTRVQDSAWVERSASNSITSGTVQTTGPAVLVAWWWGSGGVRSVGSSHVAMPGDGFTLVPAATGLRSLSANGYIQVAVAYRVVNSAGTYSITWTTDNEGAQLYLVALQGD